MLNARFVPVEAWPGAKRPRAARKNSPFRGSWKNTLDTLDRELGALQARDILVQAYLQRDDIRLDGWPRSNATPTEPGVILSFATPKGQLSFPCDTYLHWQDNLRAIALALAALRAVERYGVTRQQEQYKGWAKLPPASPVDARGAAICFLARLLGIDPTSVDADPVRAYRAAAAKLHPDAGGSHEQFIELQRHYRNLGGAA